MLFDSDFNFSSLSFYSPFFPWFSVPVKRWYLYIDCISCKKRKWAFLPPGTKTTHSTAQVSLLFSTQRSCHFHTQLPRRLNSKRTCAHLLDLWVWSDAFLTNAILWHQKAFAPLKSTSGAMLSSCLQGALSGHVYTGTFTRHEYSACDTMRTDVLQNSS